MDEENILELSNIIDDELTLCVKRGSGDNINNYIMKPGEIAYSKDYKGYGTIKINSSKEEKIFNELPAIVGNPIEWVCTIYQDKWNPLCFVGIPALYGANFIINISGTRMNVVYNDTYIITSNYPHAGRITRISGANYPSNANNHTIRLSVDYVGNCIVEFGDWYGNMTDQKTIVNCKIIPISVSVINTFNDSSTVEVDSTYQVAATLDHSNVGSMTANGLFSGEFDGTMHGRLVDNKMINTSWISGRDGSLIWKHMPSSANTGTYIPMASVDGLNGVWTIGCIGDDFTITYAPNDNYNTNNNRDYQNFYFYKNGSTSFASSYLPLSGGEMGGSAVIKFTSTAGTLSTSTPMSITYGTIASYGTLTINADTDSSGNEYILLTSGKGLSSQLADGLAIGQSTLRWQGNDIIHSGNIGSQSVNYASNAGAVNGYDVLHAYPWWTQGSGQNVDDLINGHTFAYPDHGAPVSGPIISFGNRGYWTQIHGSYSGYSMHYRSRNGDNGTWMEWCQLVDGRNIGSYTAGNANAVNGCKICVGEFDVPSYSTSGSNGYNYYGDVAVSATFDTAFSNNPYIFLQSGYPGTEGVIALEPITWTTTGISTIRVHRSSSANKIDGFTAYYIAIRKEV